MILRNNIRQNPPVNLFFKCLQKIPSLSDDFTITVSRAFDDLETLQVLLFFVGSIYSVTVRSVVEALGSLYATFGVQTGVFPTNRKPQQGRKMEPVSSLWGLVCCMIRLRSNTVMDVVRNFVPTLLASSGSLHQPGLIMSFNTKLCPLFVVMSVECWYLWMCSGFNQAKITFL